MAPQDVQASDKGLAGLLLTIDTVFNLTSQLQSTTTTARPTPNNSRSTSDTSSSNTNIDVLNLAYDAAKLLKAHSTKVSLLIINKPFTPSAIATVLRELAAGPLPALGSAAELCDEFLLTKLMVKELRWRIHNVFTEFTNLVQEIPRNGETLTAAQKNGSTTDSSGNKGSLASTGVLWKACDDLMALKTMGIAGLVVKQAENYRATLQDALEELQEWAEEEDDSDDDDADDAYSDDEQVDPAQKAIDDMFNNQRHIPKDDVNNIRSRLDITLKRLKLMSLMITAVTKRRFKTLPAPPLSPKIVSTLDDMLDVLKKLPDLTDELANAFYELDVVEIDRRMDEVFLTGFAAAEYMLNDWKGKEDEFTDWVCTFYRDAFRCEDQSGW